MVASSSYKRHLRVLAIGLVGVAVIACQSSSSSPTGAPTGTATAPAMAPPTAPPTATPATEPTSYALIDLGIVDESAELILVGVNDAGSVVWDGFMKIGGGVNPVSPAPGQTRASVSSINASNMGAGAGFAGAWHATRWTDPHTGVDLGTLGGDTSHALHIGDSGIVVGTSDTPGNATTHAFMQQGAGPMVDLNSVVVSGPAMNLRQAWAVNPSGIIVGWAGPNGHPRAFVLTSGGALTEIVVPTMPNAIARDINDAGHVTGSAMDGINTVGFLWDGSTVTALPTLPSYQLTHPYAINDRDQIVGCGRNMSDDSLVHAFLYRNGAMIDLNSFAVVAGSGWTLECATGINDNGAIVGTAWDGTNFRAFMLLPE